MRTFVSILSVFLLAACYTTVPLETRVPPDGTELEVHLTDAGTDSLARWLGPGAEVVQGDVVRGSDSAFTLSVNSVTLASGIEQFWKGENVRIPRAAIATVRRRKLSRARSALFVALGAVGAVAIGTGINAIAGTSGGNSRGGGGQTQ